MRATSMPLTQPCMRISRTRLFSKTHGTDDSVYRCARSDIRVSFVSVPYSISVYGGHLLNPLHLTARAFEWTPCPRRALPRLLLYYAPVRLPYRHASALPLQLVGAFNQDETALPGSDANSSITCHGLRPRHAAYTLTVIACGSTGFRLDTRPGPMR